VILWTTSEEEQKNAVRKIPTHLHLLHLLIDFIFDHLFIHPSTFLHTSPLFFVVVVDILNGWMACWMINRMRNT